jgi:hypothetical protein
LTYAEAAQLTWPQVLHAIGVESTFSEKDLGSLLKRSQDRVFDAIAFDRRCLPLELLRLPLSDLIALTEAEGKRPNPVTLLASLHRYLQERP